MKKIVFALILSLSFFVGSTFQVLTLDSQVVHAQETIELNIGQAAKDADVIGTADYDPDDGEAGFGLLLTRILTIVVTIAALLVFIYLLWGGMEWITAGGDKSKIEKARNRIMQSILGLIVLAAVIAIFVMIQSFLGIEVITFV